MRSKHSLFQDFSVEQRKQFTQKIQAFRGSYRKCIFSNNFMDRTKLMILIHLQRLGAEHHWSFLLNYCKIKFRKRFFKILCLYIFFLCVFLLETDGKWKNYACTGLGNSIPQKIMFLSTIQVKNCGRRCIFSRKSAIFQEKGKTHPNIRILTMCKIYNSTTSLPLIC